MNVFHIMIDVQATNFDIHTLNNAYNIVRLCTEDYTKLTGHELSINLFGGW